MEPECHTALLLSRPGKNQESWALDLELEDLKLLCPDGSEAGLDEYERCHLAAVPGNAVVVRTEDKCRVWKYLERLQVGVDRNCICVCSYHISVETAVSIGTSQVSAKLSSLFLTECVGDARMTDTSCADLLTTHTQTRTHTRTKSTPTHIMHALMH